MSNCRACARRAAVLGLALCAWAGAPATAGAKYEPAPGTAFVESTSVPARVYYDAAYAAAAQLVLPLIEKVWKVQIDQMGFARPLVLRDGEVLESFDLYLTKLPAQAGYTFDVQGDIADTPRSECPVIGIVNGDYADTEQRLVDAVGHLLNHASLHAQDCLEPFAQAYDLFSVAVQTLSTKTYLWPQLLGGFQRYPHYPIDGVPGMISIGDDLYYSFGVALLPVFLDTRYGKGDGSSLPAYWTRMRQDGHVTAFSGEQVLGDVENDPDYLAAIDLVLRDKGASLDEAMAEFVVWRLLVGANDDGQHFADGAAWTGAEVALDTTHALGALPLTDGAPTNPPGSYGASYIAVDTADATAGQSLRFTLRAAGPARWAASLVCLATDGSPARVTPFPLSGEDPTGSAVAAEIATCRQVVLAVANLAEPGFRPSLDLKSWQRHYDFNYDVALIDAPPGAADEPPRDAGAPDATAADAGAPDAGAPQATGGDSGGCRAAPGAARGGSLPCLLLLLVIALRRRRRAG